MNKSYAFMVKKLAKKVIAWLSATEPLAFLRKTVSGIISCAITSKHGVVIYYDDPERVEVLDLICKIKNEAEMLLDYNEAYQVFVAARGTRKIDGDVAEVGVYQGGSAKLICEAKGDRPLHLFDTFEGLPDLCEVDDPKQFHKGEFLVSLEFVKDYLKEYPNVHFYKGLFPSTAEPVKSKKFSFVHLDVDLYESTLNCIEFFYPRMSSGGIIISHDYISSVGVREAFDAFFGDKPEPVIELPGSQCMVVKV